jgi:hypothetical protein
MTFFSQLGGTLSVGIAQSIFINSLTKRILEKTTAVSPKVVIAAGATRLETLDLQPEVLKVVQGAFSFGVVNTLIFALVLACIAVPVAASMEWKNVKKVAAERDTGKAGSTSDEENVAL